MRNITKASRDASRLVQFERLTAQGATHEVYKGLDIFTYSDETSHFIKVFQGNAANHFIYERYRKIEDRDNRVNQAKATHDRRSAWKEEQKTANKGKSSTHAAAAAAIRTELNNTFKGFKFSVTSDTFSGGNAVRIHWTDGPTAAEVTAISGRYQYGHFNGMEDIYEYSNNVEGLPQVKYVTESRTMSETVKEFTMNKLTELWQDRREAHELERELYQIFSASSLPPDAELTGIDTDSQTWKLTYKQPEQPQQQVRPAAPAIAGQITVINYSEKAIAVIGEGTKEIKEELKQLGGRFNKYLSCGAGWIFSKARQQSVIDYLTTVKQKQEQTMGGLKTEVTKMVEAFAEIDKEIHGEITEQTKEIAQIQNVPLNMLGEPVEKLNNFIELSEDEIFPKEYNTLKEITTAANNGQMISLYNLSNLVNQPNTNK